jgi:hypothetical protein
MVHLIRSAAAQHATRVSVQNAHLLVFAIHFDCDEVYLLCI